VTGRLLDPSNTSVTGVAVVLRHDARQWTAITSEGGLFRFEGAPSGEVELRTEVPGFDPVVLNTRRRRDVVIRPRLSVVRNELAVTEEERKISTDAARNADAISVERTMLDSLPMLDNNYLAGLSRFLNPGTAGDAGMSIIVDGMEARNVGVTASAIQEIRINNNPYTVEYPRWSRRRIEVITKSSTDRYHGTLNALFRDYHFNARDALAARRPQEQRRILEGSLFGPMGKKASFLLSGAREEEDLVAVVFARTLAGAVNANVPTPQVNSLVSLRLSKQWNDKHAMFVQQNFQDRWQNNIGAGGTTLAEAAARNRFREDELIFNHRAIVSSTFLSQFRLLLGRYWSPTESNSPAQRITVSDAFTGGGAQADRLATEFHASITWLLTQTVGRHTLKYGVNVPDWSRRGLRDQTNLAGTISYASLADLAAARPFATVLQRGDPKMIFIEKTIGGFVQDEWQLCSNLSLSAGLRYDWQNFFGDTNNFQPRLAIAFAPDRSRKWVLRAGAGYFYERSGPGPLWDILRYDGVRLRRYVFSGPPNLTASTPTSVHRLASGAELPGILQFSASAERQLTKRSMFSMTYTGVQAVQQLRSRDANAPLAGVRPNAALNVLRLIESAGRMEGNTLEFSLRGDIAPRVTGMAQYSFGKTVTNTGGVNWFPADSFAPRGEWGRVDSDRRHQVNFLGTATVHRWLNFGVSLSLLSGAPFNITTGRDENGDGMAIDRPAGVARNTGKGPGAAVLDLRWYREFRFRPAQKDKSPSITLSLDAFNLPNRVNYQNFIGSLTSPFFGRAVGTLPPRRLQAGARFQF